MYVIFLIFGNNCPFFGILFYRLDFDLVSENEIFMDLINFAGHEKDIVNHICYGFGF